jgi:hypothetical protein
VGIFFYIFPLYPPGNFQGYERGYGFNGALSLLLALAYLFFALSNLTNNQAFLNIHTFLSKNFWTRVTLIALTFIGIKVIVHMLESGVHFSGIDSVGQWIEVQVISPATQLPLHFLIMDTIFFGTIVYLVLFKFRDFTSQIHNWGVGATLFTCGSLVFLLDSQARHSIHVLPFFATVVAKMVDSYQWKPQYYWSIALVSLLISKIWLPFRISNPPMYVDCTNPVLYVICMNTGPNTPPELSLYQGLILFTIGVLLYQLLTPCPQMQDKV